MLYKYIRRTLWRPFELLSRRFPLMPFKLRTTNFYDSIVRIKVDNFITRAITKIAGNYDYSVCYLIDNSLLIDTGFPWARRSIRKFLLESGAYDTIKTVINTHSHEDHTGNNDLLLNITRANVYAHRLAIKSIKYPSELPWYRNFMFGPQEATIVSEIPSLVKTNNFRFQVLHTPGHSPDHICIFEKEKKWLFSGDLYVAADLDSQLSDVDGNQWIKSLEMVLNLKPKCLFDGHGKVVQGEKEVEQLLREKITFLRTLKNRILEEAKNPIPISEITKRVFNKKTFVNQMTFSEGWLSLLTGSDFTRNNMVRSFLKDS